MYTCTGVQKGPGVAAMARVWPDVFVVCKLNNPCAKYALPETRVTLYSYCESPIGPLLLTGEQDRISGLYLSTDSKVRGADSEWERWDKPFRKVKRQIEEYFTGDRRVFELVLAPHGTEFQLDVLNALLKIPYGETRTYAEVAESVGRPKAARAVGMANGRNPIALIIPCHRVIGSDGTLTGFSGGLGAKRYLLEHEFGHSGLFA
jgi:methylated-DNA-[protein]-cysteine S-methyltransferase